MRDNRLIPQAAILLTGLVLIGPGCASSTSTRTVGTAVGPAEQGAGASAGDGWLVVYSAYETGVVDPPDVPRHSAYELEDNSGKRLREVSNFGTTYDPAPVPVVVPAGRYQIMGMAANFGRVTVPVVVRANLTTAVYLDGIPHQAKAAIAAAEAVKLPNGDVIGRRALP